MKLTVTATLLLLLSFLVYSWISSLPTSNYSDSYHVLTPDAGEELFWGKGTCHVCHRIGERGYALRGPNLGDSADGLIMSKRAAVRAQSLGLKNDVEYLVQSIMEPSAFVAPGYTNEMPAVFQAPASLSPSEVDAIIRYLFSLEGDSLSVDIQLPIEFWNAPPPASFQIDGNAENGRRLFFERSGPAACVSCHVAADSAVSDGGYDAGPDLSRIAEIRTARYLYAKIVNPDSNIVSGYTETFIKTLDGRFLFGFLREEDSSSFLLKQRDGVLIRIAKNEVASSSVQASPMPGNYAEILSEQEIHDLVAYLLLPYRANEKSNILIGR